MEEPVCSYFDGIGKVVRKKRSQTSRRPRHDSLTLTGSRERSSLTSFAPSDDEEKITSEENLLNQYMSRAHLAESGELYKRCMDSGFSEFYNDDPRRKGLRNKRSSKGVLAPASRKSVSEVKFGLDSELGSNDSNNGKDGEIQNLEKLEVNLGSLVIDSKVKKVRLKISSKGNDGPGEGSSIKSSRSLNEARQRPKQIWNQNLQGKSDERIGLRGIPWKDFSESGFVFKTEKSSIAKSSGKNVSGKKSDQKKTVSVRKRNRRVCKSSVLDGEFHKEDEDNEIRYLEKLKTKAFAVQKEEDEESGKMLEKLSKAPEVENGSTSKLVKDGKKSKSVPGDTDYKEEDEPTPETESENKKKQSKESVDFVTNNSKEMTLTIRQRALKNASSGSGSGSSLIEFPDGLPLNPLRKQKEKLSEAELQLKKTEAAQKRRVQVEKAARESEAEAIRKILSQDSSRKKREDKIKKRQEELAEEKAANARKLASSTVKLVMGPTGTTVTFPNEMGLPSIFNSKPCSYPPPREKCAGPSCTNPYKYRHSKLNLPLCSLQCYKAVDEQFAKTSS